jgi:lysine decarboxylase
LERRGGFDMNVPIYDAIKKYHDSKPTAFHMPGHKLGKGLPEEFLQGITRMDVTEIPGTDNLHYPEAVIKEAQKLASEAFGADESFFLVNGSTCGIHAMIMTVCRPGDKLVVSRDSHKSVINGLILAGAEPVYIKPEFDSGFGIPTVVTPEAVEAALKENPNAAGVLITRPNYYGICSDIQRISRLVHSYGKVLLIDEAHGAHFKFEEGLPVCAMDGGADICVQSAHKTLPAFTQGAYVHLKSEKVDAERLKFHLRLLQTSSPSYMIMASLDMARAIMQHKGKRLINELLLKIDSFISNIYLNETLQFKILSQNDLQLGQFDKTRLVINTRDLGKTGFEIEKILRQEFNIQVEMADIYNIVCISTIADEDESFNKLYNALCDIAGRFKDNAPLADKYVGSVNIPRQVMSLREVMYSKNICIRLEEAVGRISAETITPYPPGVPIVCPGEILLREAVEYIYNIINSGGVVNGLGENFEIIVV